MTHHYFDKVMATVGSCAGWMDRLVAVNPRITVRVRSAIIWRLCTEGKLSTMTKRLGLGSG